MKTFKVFEWDRGPSLRWAIDGPAELGLWVYDTKIEAEVVAEALNVGFELGRIKGFEKPA